MVAAEGRVAKGNGDTSVKKRSSTNAKNKVYPELIDSLDSKKSSFTTSTDNSNENDSDKNEERDDGTYRHGGWERWLNLILCRGDLAKEKLEAPPVSFIGLFRFASKSDRSLVIIGIIFGIITGVVQPLSMILSGKLANVLIANGNETYSEELWTNGMLIVAVNGVIGVGLIIVTFLQYFFLRLACINITNTLRNKFLQSVLRQDASWFDTQKFGAINAHLNENIDRVRDGIGDKIGLLVRGLSMFVCTVVLAFVVNWEITLVTVAVGPCCALVMSFMARMVSNAARKYINSAELAGSVLQESIMNVKTVQSCNGQSAMVEKYKKILDTGRIHGIMQYFWNGLFDGIFFVVLYLFHALGTIYGSMKFAHGEASPGDVIIVTNLLLFGAYFLGVMSPHIMSILKARVAAAVIYNRIDRLPTIDSYSQEGKKIENSKGEITFTDVSFAYPNRKDRIILDGLSWNATAGETVALVGHSGCGKSTSISLLTRLYECTSGRIEIDDVDIREINIHCLRRMIGIVQQEPVLFNGTIFDNIALGDGKITLERVESVCRMANAHDFVLKLEQGYFTEIGAGGVQLSGGQKQRIAIARAIVHDPSILLLDEATSALDAESEILVQTALQSASRGRTTIIIAHRLSTLRNVQKIIVIDQGQVVEIGSHAELAAKNPDESIYAALVKSQKFTEVKRLPTMMQRKRLNSEIYQEEAINFRTRLSSRSSNYSGLEEVIDRKGFVSPSYADMSEKCGLFNSSLGQIYRNCHGQYGKLFVGITIAAFRGLELFLYVQMINAAFVAFENFHGDIDNFQSVQLWIFTRNIALGVYCLLTIFASVSILGWAAENLVDRFKIRALDNVLQQEGAFFDRQESTNAKVVQEISSESLTLKAALDIRLYLLVNNVTACATLVIASIIFSWQISLVGLAVFGFLCALLTIFGSKMQKQMGIANSVDDSAKVAVEIIENVRTIQLLTKEKYFLQKYFERLHQTREPLIRASMYDSIMFAFTQSFMYISDLFCFGLGIYLVYHGLLLPNEAFVAAMNMGSASWAVLFVSTSFNDILRANPSAKIILELINARSSIQENPTGVAQKVRGEVELQEVDFAYPNRPEVNVANGLSFKASEGQTVALVGPSGGGKSTVISLLQRFYEPISGKARVDGVRIEKYSLHYLRSQMALVAQEPVLFSGTILDNIRLGVENEVTLNDVRDACRMANAAHFIEQLPMGYSTEVGEKGAQLSGGQKQRLAIARALIRKPKVLLLDEATSALDAQSERAVQLALDAASQGRTCITIAHRLSSIQNANQIFFVRNGRVVESGTYAELTLNENSAFAQMVKKQELL